ncbi:TetR/AcrR family transcriptional regulator [Secundilactobacillus similis]|nr:TetR family transcriptional regulator [Secundilactobacillus similis]
MSLVEEKSFEKITVRDLCQRAHLNHSTFYRQYHNKYELLMDILPEFIENVFSGEWTNSEEMLRSILAWTEDNRIVVRNLLAEIDSMTTYRELLRAVSEQILSNPIQNTVTSTLADTINRMYFPKLVAENMATLMFQVVLQWADQSKFTEAKREAYIADVLRLFQL